MACYTSSGVGRRKMRLTKKQIDALNAKYNYECLYILSLYKKGNYEQKIDMHLAKRRIRIFLMEAIENLLYGTYDGKKYEVKMVSYKKRVIQNQVLKQQEILWRQEKEIHNLYNMIAPHSPNKNRVRDKINNDDVYEPLDDDIEKLSENFSESVLPPFVKIAILCAERDILFYKRIIIDKHLLNLYKTPRSDELEKLMLARFRLETYKTDAKLYEKICRLYFRELPLDDEYRANAREMILGSNLLFPPAIYSILYDPTIDAPNIWWNFQELISPDRELQFIAKELVSHVDKIRYAHGPTVRFQEKTFSRRVYLPSYAGILANTNITEFIRTSPHLPHANDRINDIPPEVFEERKELFEEIIKTKCWEYIRGGFCFSLI